MNPNLTDITLVIDRSGSMESCREDMQGGVNTLIKEQAKQAGDAVLTLVKFDTEYDFVYKGTPIKKVQRYELVPRGSTALLDAVGRAINETGERLATMPEDERPGLVIFAIVTDGQENSSKEFELPQIKAMIQHQTDTYNWQFTFLGANQDAFAAAGGMGITADATLNYDASNSHVAMRALSANVSSVRQRRQQGEEAQLGFSPEQRAEAVKES